MLHLPKPLLSANLYCDSRLDESVHELLAPFWAAAADFLPRSQSYLWFIRYARGGEHLKLRLHAPSEHEPAIRRLLETMAQEFFDRLGPADTSAERKNNPTLPPIDPEDAVEAPHSDRTLLWTCYEPSPITLGSTALVPDERYLALFTRCLAAGSEVVLAELAPDGRGEYSWRMRQNLVIKLALALFEELPFSLSELHAYFTYHRDWLVRYLLFRGRSDGTAEDLVAKFEQRAREMAGVIGTLREVLEARAEAAATGSDDASAVPPPDASRPGMGDDGDVYAALGARMNKLFDYIVRFRSAEQPALDPYAPDQVYLPIFKCLHGLANQVGLGMPKEAQIYHLLAAAAAAGVGTAAAGDGAVAAP